MLKLDGSKIVAADDGKVYLCVPITTNDVEHCLSVLTGLVGEFRAMKYKVRTSEITRFREKLVA